MFGARPQSKLQAQHHLRFAKRAGLRHTRRASCDHARQGETRGAFVTRSRLGGDQMLVVKTSVQSTMLPDGASLDAHPGVPVVAGYWIPAVVASGDAAVG